MNVQVSLSGLLKPALLRGNVAIDRLRKKNSLSMPKNMLRLNNVDSNVEMMIKAVIIVLAVAVQRQRNSD